tara:strand:+ start:121 stop:357 length:237 start_codon:yes stop_codon:yes gene_type:complete
MYRDEECVQCVIADDPIAVWENPDEHSERAIEEDRHIPYTGPLPSKDPYVQEFREKYGRRLQEELYPECDEINGGLRR